jgi:predicted Fe-Mo cluster-binding NifX family protein
MRIAVSASEPTLDAEIDPRFGRCRYLIIVDADSMEFEAVENSGASAGGGAGIATAQMAIDKRTEVVITGNCGPSAFQVLSAAGIKVVTGIHGKVQDVVQVYKAGTLQPTFRPNVRGHFGMGSGRGTGRN